MPDKDPATGKFVKSEPAEAPAAKVHPSLRPRRSAKKIDAKIRRTTVRTVKLINPLSQAGPQLIQIPHEPSHNNAGNAKDATVGIRKYLDKGFVWPWEFDGEIVVDGDVFDHKRIFCAVKDCWSAAEADSDPDGVERCLEHDDLFRRGYIRYAVPGE